MTVFKLRCVSCQTEETRDAHDCKEQPFCKKCFSPMTLVSVETRLRKRAKSGYRVEILTTLRDSARKKTGERFIAYTDPKTALDEDAARSFAAHLQRSNTGWRILSNVNDRVVEEWRP